MITGNIMHFTWRSSVKPTWMSSQHFMAKSADPSCASLRRAGDGHSSQSTLTWRVEAPSMVGKRSVRAQLGGIPRQVSAAPRLHGASSPSQSNSPHQRFPSYLPSPVPKVCSFGFVQPMADSKDISESRAPQPFPLSYTWLQWITYVIKGNLPKQSSSHLETLAPRTEVFRAPCTHQSTLPYAVKEQAVLWYTVMWRCCSCVICTVQVI